jgi:S-adenosylmethionine:tRNA ribosyltransferase-isomerase
MLTADFDFQIPEELIAQYPAEPRDHSRLMVVDRARGRIEHHQFSDLPSLLDSRDILVLNNTRVIPARLVGHRERTQGNWQGLFVQEFDDGSWEVLATTRGRPSVGESVIIDGRLRLVLKRRTDSGSWVVQPCIEDDALSGKRAYALLERYGQVPLPPYIQKRKENSSARTRYQTIFGTRPGSIAAPTAGLHFTQVTFRELARRDIGCVSLTLHVGVGTFQPIKCTEIADHVMHAEWTELSSSVVKELNARRTAGGRIVAVGSTCARALETASAHGDLTPFVGQTRLFIQPGHVFRGLDALITNFHLPRTTLLVLVSAFAGLELTRLAYLEAIANRYRFFSYGDAMLIL